MLFRFASYLLGTNNDTVKDEREIVNQKINDTQCDLDVNLIDKNLIQKERSNRCLNNQKTGINENDQTNNKNFILYNESIIKRSNFMENNLEENFCLNSPNSSNNSQNEDCDDEDQWIYITPIKCENLSEQNDDKENGQEFDEQNITFTEKDLSNTIVPNQKHSEGKVQFNFYDYFNNKNSLENQESYSLSSLLSKSAPSSNNTSGTPAKSLKNSSFSSTISSSNLSNNHENAFLFNKLEDSWVIHPPACFQLDNTFTIEEHPMENLYIENPALSVIASIKLDKENNIDKTNANKSVNSNKQLTKSITSKKSMRNKRTKKHDKKTKTNVNSKSYENVDKNNNTQKQQVLLERQQKKLIAQYLNINPNYLNNSTPMSGASSTSNGTFSETIPAASSNSDNVFGSKSLRRNNKVALQRENLVKKPFTLHRKLC